VHVKIADVGFAHADEFGGPVMDAPAGHRVRLDKVLFRSGLCSSISEATRKIKEKAVRHGQDGKVEISNVLYLDRLPFQLILRVGRKAKRVVVER
jgi:tyrosyl-tRNA synthetase